jgi:hypothetical protein
MPAPRWWGVDFSDTRRLQFTSRKNLRINGAAREKFLRVR